MAKSKSDTHDNNGKRINKSEAVREAIGLNPLAGSKEIVSQLAEKGIKVAPTLVYYVRSKQKHAQRRAKREQVAETSRQTATGNPVELVHKVKVLAREIGGIRNLKRLVDLLAE